MHPHHVLSIVPMFEVARFNCAHKLTLPQMFATTLRSTLRTLPKKAPTRGMSRLAPAQAGSLLDIGIRDIFDSDHDQFRESARHFFDTEVKPNHAEWEKNGEVSRELWLKAGEMGLLSNMVPEEYGGLGLDCKYPAIVWEEQSYSGCTGES